MLRALLNLFRRPPIRFGMARDDRSRFRNPRFASFLAENNRGRLDTDFQDTVLRARKFGRRVVWFALAGCATWVALESAKAWSIF